MTKAWDEIGRVHHDGDHADAVDRAEHARAHRDRAGHRRPGRADAVGAHAPRSRLRDDRPVEPAPRRRSARASVPPDLLRRMRTVLGVPMINRYASTEAGGVISGSRPDDPDEVVLETVGRPSDGVEIRVVDDDGNEVLAGRRHRPGAGAIGGGDARLLAATPTQPPAVLDARRLGDRRRRRPARRRRQPRRSSDATASMYLRGGYNVYPVEVERRARRASRRRRGGRGRRSPTTCARRDRGRVRRPARRRPRAHPPTTCASWVTARTSPTTRCPIASSCSTRCR